MKKWSLSTTESTTRWMYEIVKLSSIALRHASEGGFKTSQMAVVGRASDWTRDTRLSGVHDAKDAKLEQGILAPKRAANDAALL